MLDELCLGIFRSPVQRFIIQRTEEPEVVGNGSFHHKVILEHHAEFLPECFVGDGADILSVNVDLTGIRIIQPQQQIQNGGLAGTGGAQDAQGLSVFQAEGQVGDIGADTGVGEGHIPEFDMGRLLQNFTGFFNQQILGSDQNLANPAGTGFALGPHDEDSGNAHHGIEDHGKVLQEGHNDAAFTGTAVDPVGTDHYHQRQTQIQHQGRGGICDGGYGAGLHVNVGQFLVHVVEPVLFVLSFTQGLDDPDAGDVFLNHPDNLIQHGLLMGIHGNTDLGDQVHQHSDNGQQSNQNQGKGYVHAEHHNDAAHQQNGSPDTQPLDTGQHLVDVIGITGQPGFGGGNRQFIHLPGRQTFQLLEQIMADGQRDLTGGDGGHSVGPDVQAQTKSGAQDHQAAVDINADDLTCGDFVIQHDLHQIRDEELHDSAGQFDEHGKQNMPPIRSYISLDIFQLPRLHPFCSADLDLCQQLCQLNTFYFCQILSQQFVPLRVHFVNLWQSIQRFLRGIQLHNPPVLLGWGTGHVTGFLQCNGLTGNVTLVNKNQLRQLVLRNARIGA